MSYRPGEFLSEEGRAINYVYLSEPSVEPLAATANSTKLKVYIQAAIHGNVSQMKSRHGESFPGLSPIIVDHLLILNTFRNPRPTKQH